ncbi:HPF/RaiA family ribosome-associated protein [Mucilaginibacter sp. UR6-1]|uniref:HPF/RaiA family ribosome-associated protein n=1 Tax=Mucilaginibacter sp. UR6-1 TaxID=1435643 RepID=UPI001E4BCED9|nr:HPF/RaiA family ribosome-associated protein [Mucilaginibacter sp. UR6-1]MCC8410776.1 HPF/RaiA family ribosome-associated protein [Mucilaginibacter sp. UR6-1]
MNIQINTDKNIDGNERLQAFLEDKLTNALSRFESHLTRIELHLSDENAGKSGPDDKRCLLEARIEGHEPLSVRANGDTVETAVNDAINKIKNLLDHVMGKQNLKK